MPQGKPVMSEQTARTTPFLEFDQQHRQDLGVALGVADHLFGLSGAGHRPANPGIPPSTAEGSRELRLQPFS